MANAVFYNDTKYSDFSVKLSDDREINLHKFVVCNNSEYFNKLCGEGSQFAESKQKLIVLKEDDPDVVEYLLRYLYGCTLPQDRKPWRFWFALITVADKYLEPALSDAAEKRLMHTAENLKGLGSTDVVFDVIQEIKAGMAHHQSLLDFAEQLRKQHLTGLLVNERYRELLVSDPALMLAQLDELEPRREFSEKAYFVCGHHEDRVFQEPGDDSWRRCIKCSSKGVLPGPGRVVYLPK